MSGLFETVGLLLARIGLAALAAPHSDRLTRAERKALTDSTIDRFREHAATLPAGRGRGI